MDGYAWRALILKQRSAGYSLNGAEVKGIVKVGLTSDSAEFTVTTINAAPLIKGKYVFMIKGSGKMYYRENVDVNETFVMNADGGEFDKGFACVLAAVTDETVVPVTFGASSETKLTAKEMTDIYEEEKNFNGNQGSYKEKGSREYEKRTSETGDLKYNDETVAADNYYENKDVDVETLTLKGEKNQNERGKFENSQNDEAYAQDKSEKSFGYYGKQNFENEARYSNGEEHKIFNSPLGYFEKIKGDLDGLFLKFPAEEKLNTLVPESKWVKINYNEEKFYVVGIIYHAKKPLYICYGVPGNYGSKPDELKEYCSFIPSSLFDLKNNGYWVMYQDASTGACINGK